MLVSLPPQSRRSAATPVCLLSSSSGHPQTDRPHGAQRAAAAGGAEFGRGVEARAPASPRLLRAWLFLSHRFNKVQWPYVGLGLVQHVCVSLGLCVLLWWSAKTLLVNLRVVWVPECLCNALAST